MFNDLFMNVLRQEGMVYIITRGNMTTSFNYQLKVKEDKIYIPTSSRYNMEESLKENNKLSIILNNQDYLFLPSRPITTFHITGKGFFLYEGKEFDDMKKLHPWMTAVLEVHPEKVEQVM